jgi:hypothetical protein
MPDSDCDPDSDPANAFPAALSGSHVKATGFAGGYLLFLRLELSVRGIDVVILKKVQHRNFRHQTEIAFAHALPYEPPVGVVEGHNRKPETLLAESLE